MKSRFDYGDTVRYVGDPNCSYIYRGEWIKINVETFVVRNEAHFDIVNHPDTSGLFELEETKKEREERQLQFKFPLGCFVYCWDWRLENTGKVLRVTEDNMEDINKYPNSYRMSNAFGFMAHQEQVKEQEKIARENEIRKWQEIERVCRELRERQYYYKPKFTYLHPGEAMTGMRY